MYFNNYYYFTMKLDGMDQQNNVESKTQKKSILDPAKMQSFIKDWWFLIASLITSSWVIWKFLFDISVPVNIVVKLDSKVDALSNVEISKMTTNDKQILPIKFSASAKNISGRKTLNIYNPVWIAYGTTLLSPRAKWAERNDEIALLAEREFGHTRRYQQLRKARGMSIDSVSKIYSDSTKRRLEDFAYSRSLIGVGTLFGNNELKPLEEITSEQIIPVLKGKYDIVEVRLYVPTTDANRRLGLFGLVGPMPDKDSINAFLASRSFDKSDLALPPKISMSFFRIGTDGVPISDWPISKQEQDALGAQIQTSSSQLWVGPATISPK